MTEKKDLNRYLTKMVDKLPHYLLADNGHFPNSRLPVLLYKSVFILSTDHNPEIIEQVFKYHNWSNSWRNGIYTYNHYHSISHEVLGVYCGRCHVQLGGHNGIQLILEKGDVLIIPAGVSHCNIGSTIDFKCVGAYPGGSDFDINLGKSDERPKTDQNIKKVSIPDLDPVYGEHGHLHTYWND